mgnify:CR=1 FL=1
MKQFLKIGLLFSCFFVSEAKQYEIKGVAHTKYSSRRQKKKLFKSVGCEYLNFMEIDVPNFDTINPKETQHYLTMQSVIQTYSKKYHDQVQHYALAPMYLQWISPDIGYGVFAEKEIKKDNFIGVYAGQLREIRNPGDIMPEDVDYAWFYSLNAPSGKRLLVDGKFKGNELRFINHDQNPNTKCIDVLVNGRFYMCYIATKNILKNSQLTISYGDGYWESRKINPEKIK